MTRKTRKIIAILVLILIVSCRGDQRVYDKVYEFEKNNLCDLFRGYSLRIMSVSNLRIIKFDTTRYIIFSRSMFGLKVQAHKNIDKIPVSEILDGLNRMEVLSFESDEKCCVIYSRLADSTYYDLLRSNPRFVDNTISRFSECLGADCPYRIVFVRTRRFLDIPPAIRRNHTIRPLRDGWYYFRSYDYHSHDAF
jgi:hypothetical protein